MPRPFSVRKFPQKINFTFPCRQTWEESKHPTECAMKNNVIMHLIREHAQIKRKCHLKPLLNRKSLTQNEHRIHFAKRVSYVFVFVSVCCPFLLEPYFVRFDTFCVRGGRGLPHRTIQREPECFDNHTEVSFYTFHIRVQMPRTIIGSSRYDCGMRS